MDQLLLEEATLGLKEIESVMVGPPPSVRFNPGPWSGALIYQVVFSVGQFADLPVARSEMRKRIFIRLRREGIEPSFPADSTPNAYEASGN